MNQQPTRADILRIGLLSASRGLILGFVAFTPSLAFGAPMWMSLVFAVILVSLVQWKWPIYRRVS